MVRGVSSENELDSKRDKWLKAKKIKSGVKIK
jgi:hypothetical protein